MKRLHVHVSVDNLADRIWFYSGMFAAQPTIVKAVYAKWQLDDPRINFAISQRGAEVGLNHLGIQVESAQELAEMQSRLAVLQPDIEKEEGVACCYANSDKNWANAPCGIPWETFLTLDTIPVFGEPDKKAPEAACCIPSVKPKTESKAACCAPAGSPNKSSTCC